MSLKDFARTVLPTRTLAFSSVLASDSEKPSGFVPALTENTFRTILTDDLGLEDGDTFSFMGRLISLI